MSTFVNAMLLLALSVLPVFAGVGDEKADPKPVAGPRMEISPEAHDFGNAKQNQALVKEFEIENIGSENLELGRISTSCGCTVARPEVKLLKPGSKTLLKVTLETRRYKGQLQRSVSIASNDPRRVKTIKVKVFVEE